MLRTNSKIKIMGNESEADSYYSNYMQIHGMAVPGKVENKVHDQLMGTIVIDTLDLNMVLPDSLFEKPAKKL